MNENRSDASNAASATVADTQEPERAAGTLAATAAVGQVALTWEAASDNVGVTGDRIYRGGSQVGSVDPNTLSFTNTSLPAGPHSFTVRAVDAAGNLSDPSNTATATVPDTDKPSAPSNLAGIGSRPGRAQLKRVHRQRGRHRLPRVPQRHPDREPALLLRPSRTAA